MRHAAITAGLVLVALTCVSCQTAYYAAWEQLGKEKRHLLRDNVKKASEEQQEASEQFQDVLTQIKELYGFDGGDLEQAYRQLKDDYEDSEDRAAAVRGRIENVEQIAADLFDEWEQEIQHISSASLQQKSRDALRKTQQRYDTLRQTMRNAEQRMNPVLTQVRDYVLYLKHNLNAQAVGALRQEVDRIEIEVDALIDDMNTSIREAEDFLQDFE